MLGDHVDLGPCLCSMKSFGSPISQLLWVWGSHLEPQKHSDLICDMDALNSQVQFKTQLETVRDTDSRR